MAPPLAELTAHAQTLTSAGDLVAARTVLTDALQPVDPDPQRATPDLADAATLLARVLIALGDPHAARVWAGFAHAAQDRLYGSHDERTVAAAALHAAVLHRVGNHGRAAQLYHDLVGELTALDGPDSPRTLAAEADLATTEHAAGHCTAARARLADAAARFRRTHGDAAPAGIKMLARLGAMERECGRADESRRHLELVQELCARYLPADHPLAVQAMSLAQAPASGRHACGRVERATGTTPGSTTGAAPEYRREAPPAPEPDEPPTDPKGLYQQPLYLSDVHQPRGHRTGRHVRADAPPPQPGQRPPGIAPDGREVQIGAATVPAVPDRRLPVPVDRPAPRGSWQPLALVGVLIAGIAVAGAVVIATLPRADGGTTSGPSAASQSASSRGGPAPADVRLRDNRDSVSLDWTYPAGAEGPVLISGGRTGEPRRAFQQLPAGTTTYVVYGLSDQLDYCFTVAVVYTADHVAESAPLCTRRT